MIKSVFPAHFDFGEASESGVNPETGTLVNRFYCETQVVFGGKGSNLMFRDLVNGNVVSKAVIEFEAS